MTRPKPVPPPQTRADAIGKRFGMLVVESFAETRGKNSHWHCRCDCGGTTVSPWTSLRAGRSTSCGCQRAAQRTAWAKKTFEARFWKKVDRTAGPDACWPWLARCEEGYGALRVEKKNRRATHVALELAGRPLPDGLFALHRCNNPPCVNPKHLFAGTQKDNIHDMLAKGRAAFQKRKARA